MHTKPRPHAASTQNKHKTTMAECEILIRTIRASLPTCKITDVTRRNLNTKSSDLSANGSRGEKKTEAGN